MLSDGKTVCFEYWVIGICQKLEVNVDHFPTPLTCKIYVTSHCMGRARLHIERRLDPESEKPYADADDMIAHLKIVFYNPNRRVEALIAYHALRMKSRDSFTDFIADYL